ncbi:MAG TPA: FtsX-like permease family protein [Burkholderiaceae bacterium]|nr:FtsX-like permease family protein [Burkholderiaceae bacterium]
MNPMLSGLRAGVRALRRDWHSGEVRLLLAALITAVAAVGSVSMLADRIGQALQRDSAQMLGGDLVIRSGQPVAESVVAQAQALGLDIAHTVEFPSMVMHGLASQLVSVKAVSSGYPLRGDVRLQKPGQTEPAYPASGIPTLGAVWIDPQLSGLLELGASSQVALGDLDFNVEGVIAHEPDRSLRFVNVAPRVLMNMDDLPATGLLGPGARVTHRLLVAGAPAALTQYRRWLDNQLEPGQRIRTVENSRPGVQRTLDRANQFLALVALLTVLLAGVAIALAARRFCLRHQDGIAIMRCMGASRRMLGWMVWTQFVLLALIASLLGIGLAYLVHMGLVALVVSWLGVALPTGTGWPYLKALSTGVLLLLGFAVPPLLGLRRVPPVRVLRRDGAGLDIHYRGAYLVGLVSFGLLALALTGDMALGLTVVAGFAVALLVFVVVALLAVMLVGAVRRRLPVGPGLRFALAGISRRRALAVVQLCALAMGLSILLLLAIMRTDLLQGWKNTVPADAPNTFLINIQPDQRQALAARLAQENLGNVDLVPMVRARLVEVNGRPVSADSYDDDQARRAVNREFNLSWRSQLPAGNTQGAGRWLQPDHAEASLEADFAKTLGLGVGDTLTFEFSGQRRTVSIVGLRDVKWDSFEVNFFALLSESVLRDAPRTYITSLRFPDNSAPLVRDLLTQFPNVTVFDVGVILAQVQGVLDHVVVAIQLLFLFSVAAGMVVLGAALFATRDERMHEAALLRALGASAAQLGGALRLEMLILGALSGVLAAATAQGIAWALAAWVFKFDLSLSWWPWALGIAVGLGLALFSARLTLPGVLNVSPVASLRSSE